MFQFPGLAPCTYGFSARSPAKSRRGCPIRTSPDHRLCSGSPKLFAATYVLHRLLTPRHPPCALSSLTSLSLPKGAYSPRNLDLPPLSGLHAELALRSLSRLACQRTESDAKRPPARPVGRPGRGSPPAASAVEDVGFEPTTYAMQRRRSPN